MTIPDYQTLMRPVLEYLADGGEHRLRDLKEAMADQFNLTAEERAQMTPSGRSRLIYNRVGWATSYLAQAGLIHRPRRGYSVITAEGRRVLAEHPDRVDLTVLEQFEPFRAFRDRARNRDGNKTPQPPVDLDDSSATPQDLIDAAVLENQATLETELLDRALTLSPTGFEDLVIRLLEKMGYGRAGNVERTSASGDAGVDGIISQDPLGLDRIYVQAKRYALDRTVDRPRIHEFAGALLGKQGDRGVFITTSSFTRGALLEAERINARIELIDGARLARLLVQYGVGVQESHTVVLHRIDEDFFEEI